MPAKQIELRGVAVHNLKEVDLDLPHRQLIAFCGVSGSGKTSLAFDTLYAEGQRRYIESFSAYTRQFLEQLEKPDAERIDGLPPAIAVTRKDVSQSNRSTVATATEIADYLRLLFAKVGHIFCHGCGREVRRDSPQTAARRVKELPIGARLMVTFSRTVTAEENLSAIISELVEDGFVRAIIGNQTVNLASHAVPPGVLSPSMLFVIVDRLTVGGTSDERLQDSLETASAKGTGTCTVLWSADDAATNGTETNAAAQSLLIDGRSWQQLTFSSLLRCEPCQREYPPPEPRLFSFNSPLGACPACEGFGNLIDVDMARVIPDPTKSVRDGAIAPWNTPAYESELADLLALAADVQLPTDVPYKNLTPSQQQIIREGVPARNYGGLNGFFTRLEKQVYKMHLRVFLSRWRSQRECPTCTGQRLRPESLAARVGGKNIAEVMQLKIEAARPFFDNLPLTDFERQVCGTILEQIQARLRYLDSVGLGYLTLNRTLKTLSDGEGQRVALTTALGSNLVNMLYVLDEPSVGLHPRDVQRLIGVIRGLRDRGNSVVVVEHEEEMLQAADLLVEVGPGAGERGGEIVFQGTLAQMKVAPNSLTGDYLTGRRVIASGEKRRSPAHGWLRLTGARGNNLKNVTVEFPLGVMCLVTGVSGAGKSSLVQDTLYGAVSRRKHKDADIVLPYDDVYGDGQIDDVVLVDQSPIGRSPRSNPVTYIKAFDQIRAVFAETVEARTHNYTAGQFSFNVAGGRCETCEGDGHLRIDMQFLPDVFMRCSQCGGTRYRKEILEVTYRGCNIADVLAMTVRQAFIFFRGQAKVQNKLKQLIDVGLDYLQLGQAANTLSAGESQRLKLAAHLSAASRNRTLFILDEPTTGLHFHDIVQLLDCFEALLNVGHSLIIVEHNLQLMKAADYIIDIGPGPAEAGGRIVAQGTPEKIARCAESVTGQMLARIMTEQLKEQSA